MHACATLAGPCCATGHKAASESTQLKAQAKELRLAA